MSPMASPTTGPSSSPMASPTTSPSTSPTTGTTTGPSGNATPPPPPEPSRTVTEADSGSSVSLAVGEVLEVRLDGAWVGPASTGGLYLVEYSQSTDATTARFQALQATGAPEQLSAHSDAACLHADPACAVPTRSWTLDVTVTGRDDSVGSYPCYTNPSPSPAPGSSLTKADGRTVTVLQGQIVAINLDGCQDPYTVPIVDGASGGPDGDRPLFREYAIYQANGRNSTGFRAVSLGRTAIATAHNPACLHLPSERACARPAVAFQVTVEVIPGSCPPTIELPESTITATGSAEVTIRGGGPGRKATLLAYTRPSTTYRVVRSGTFGEDGTITFSVRPPANTRLYATAESCTSGPSIVLNVRTALTLTAERLGTRTYRFAGDSLPARPGGLIVSLYRVTEQGRQVLTAQARADAADGTWSLDRTFTGTGRFGFLVRTGQDLQNAPGASNVRSTLIF